MFKDLLDSQAGAALGTALGAVVGPMMVGRQAQVRPAPAQISEIIPAPGAAPPTPELSEEDVMAMIDKFKAALVGKSPKEAAFLLATAANFDPLAKVMLDDMLRINGEPASIAEYLASRRVSNPQFAPLMDWLGDNARFDWLVETVAEVKKLHSAPNTPAKTPAKAGKKSPF